MKRLFMVALLLGLAFRVAAAGPDQQYVQIYMLIQQADTHFKNGEFHTAAERYHQAHSDLRKLQLVYPAWNDRVVKFRLNYLGERLHQLSEYLPAPGVPAAQEAPAVATPPDQRPAPELVASQKELDELQQRVDSLGRRLQHLQSENATLQGQLREALAVQPAASDPRELARAEQSIRSLQKDRDLLQVSLNQERARSAELAELAESLEAAPARTDPRAAARLEEERARWQQQLDDANRQLASLDARHMQELTTIRAELNGLRRERDGLQRQIELADENAARLKADPARVQSADAEMGALRHLENERHELQKQLEAADHRAGELELARADLQRQLDRAPAPPARDTSQPVVRLAEEVEQLRARIAVLEAEAVPFTAEELALFSKPAPQLAAAVAALGEANVSAASQKPGTSPPPIIDPDASAAILIPPAPPRGAETLARRAERAFAAGRFDEAERTYLEILRQDDRSAYTLGNLAAVQVERGRLDEAEANLNRALQSHPNDPFSLTLLGLIKLQQENYDEALNWLSRSAKLHPENAETQTYLGVTLTELGQRGPAEAALRKAIRLEPRHPIAHHNLALIYATQDPPFIEMARFHYERAVQLGHGRNSHLEQVLAGR